MANYSQKTKEMNDHQTNLDKLKKKQLLHELWISFFSSSAEVHYEIKYITKNKLL